MHVGSRSAHDSPERLAELEGASQAVCARTRGGTGSPRLIIAADAMAALVTRGVRAGTAAAAPSMPGIVLGARGMVTRIATIALLAAVLHHASTGY